MGLIKKPYELKVKKTLSVLIYGQPGIGKTTLALSAPHPLLLDFDGGVHRVNASHRVDTVQIERWEDVIELLKSPEIAAYQSLVVDTTGKMLTCIEEWIMRTMDGMKKTDGSLKINGYGVRKNKFIWFLKEVSFMGKTLVFVAHEREEKVGEEKQIRPEIGGSSTGDLIKELDLVGYMEAKGTERTISFNPCEKFYGKNTCNLSARIDIPTIVDKKGFAFCENDFMTREIIQSYYAFQEKQTEICGEYEQLMELIKAKIEVVNDADTANEVAGELAGMQHIFDSKLQAGMLLNQRCKKLGLKFNKVTKSYEAA